MRKLIKIALVALGIRALLHGWKRRHAEPEPEPEPALPPPDPAAELRQKLAASRADDGAGEPEAAPEASVEDRRAEVHTQGRATVDEMTSSDEA